MEPVAIVHTQILRFIYTLTVFKNTAQHKSKLTAYMRIVASIIYQ